MSLICATELNQDFLTAAHTLFGVCGGHQGKIQRKTVCTIGPANGQDSKAFEEQLCVVVPSQTEKLYPLGSGAIARVVVDDHHGLSLLAGPTVKLLELLQPQAKEKADAR